MGGLCVGGGIHEVYEVTFSKRRVPVERLGGMD